MRKQNYLKVIFPSQSCAHTSTNVCATLSLFTRTSKWEDVFSNTCTYSVSNAKITLRSTKKQQFQIIMGVRNWRVGAEGRCILGQDVFRRALFGNSWQLQSLQLPAAFKNGYFIALLARNFQFFSRSRAYPKKNRFCGRRARKKSIFNKIFIACTCIMHSCML